MSKVKFLDLEKITAQHGDEISQAVQRVVNGGWYLLGNEVKAFESDYARYIGTEHCVGCASGLDALILMLQAYKELGVLRDGDEVIVPANTYIATILAITENNLKPVLVEPDADTLQIDERQIEKYLTNRTKALMIVHLYGRSAYSSRIVETCKEHGLLLLEDNAQAHGCMVTLPDGTLARTGSLGDAAANSFYPGKNLGALGDGGAVTTNDKQLADVVRALANYGSGEKYVFKYQGRNSRLDEIQAAVLSVKLKYLDEENDRRRNIARIYIRSIDNEFVEIPKATLSLRGENAGAWQQNVFHLFPVLSERRNELQLYLADRGIQTLIHYPIPPHKQECYREWNELSFPLTEKIAEQELSLPISPVMTEEDAYAVVKAVNDWK